MSAFKVGQRVRIVRTDSLAYGKQATIIEITVWQSWHAGVVNGGAKAGDAAYVVDVDGVGSIIPSTGHTITFSAYDLAPLTDPDAEWAKQAIVKVTMLPERVPA